MKYNDWSTDLNKGICVVFTLEDVMYVSLDIMIDGIIMMLVESIFPSKVLRHNR